MRAHPLFRQFPLQGEVSLSTGLAPTPYHVYDGHGVFIGGMADLEAARALLAPEQVVPVQNRHGRALMGIWVFDFTDASHGAHHELQFSLYVSREPLSPVEPHPMSIIELMLGRPDVHMLCHGLWNSTPRVVAYNREVLGLDARRSHSHILAGEQRMEFAIDDAATHRPVLRGRIHDPRQPSLRANLALMNRLGALRLMRAARQPWLKATIVNPIGAVLGRNAVAESHTKVGRSSLRYFDPNRDRLEFGDARYRMLRFQPQFVQYMEGFKFVYLNPT